jgi:hypothetical protein
MSATISTTLQRVSAGHGPRRVSQVRIQARIVTTLLHEMRRRGASRGAASMCIGVGQGIASLWEAA